MEEVLVRKIKRRNPFKAVKVPWLARIYRYPFDKWASPGKQILFGAPNLLLFSLLRRLLPFRSAGTFQFQVNSQHTTVVFDARNTQFQALYRAEFASGYEPELTALFDLVMQDDGVFYDVGSNWGYFSLFIASKPGFRGKVHAFEPFPSTYGDLVSTITQAGLTGQIQSHPVALSDSEGTATMRLPDFTHSGLAKIGETQSAGRPNAIRMTTLDALHLEPPTLLKVDAEGSEAAILIGARKLIEQHQPLIVFENWRSFAEVPQTLKPLVFLRELGYVLFHPCWLRHEAGVACFIPAEGQAGAGAEEVLALVPLKPEDRFLRHDQINIFACPMNKLAKLRSLFEIHHPTVA